MNKIAEEYRAYASVGDLLDFIEKYKISRDARILVQRVEDVYFEKRGWQTIKKKGEHWHNADKWNRDVDSGKYLDKENYPDMKPENLKKMSEEDMEKLKEEYHPVWSPVFYKDDENLYLDQHY